MTSQQIWSYFIGFTLLLFVVMGFVAHYSAAPNVGFASASAVLTLIGGVAVGIERIMEVFWTFMSQFKGSWWPLNAVGQQVNNLVSSLDAKLEPFFEETNAAIDEMAKMEKWSQEKVAAAKKEVDDLRARLNKLKELAPDNQRINMIATAAFQGVSYLEKKYPELQYKASVAHQAIAGMSDFVASFKENPGKRLISIYIGAILGMIVAGAVGLDLFLAAMGVQSAPQKTGFFPYWGVAFTGLVMGLGSGPTHEIIRTIQEIKKSRKSDNDPVPVTAVNAPTGATLTQDPAQGSKGVATFSLRSPRQ